MALDIKLMFLAGNVAKKIAEFLGLIESLNSKLDRLAGSEFDAAVRSLEQAVTSESEEQSLMREARSRFNKAISLEENERLVLSYIGLAICHNQLGDVYNAHEALQATTDIELNIKTPPMEKIFFVMGGALGQAMRLMNQTLITLRKQRFEELKRSIRSFLESGYKDA